MEGLFRLNLYGSVLIILVLIIRKLFYGKLFQKTFYDSWRGILFFYIFGVISYRITREITFLNSRCKVTFQPFHEYAGQQVAGMAEKDNRISFPFLWVAGVTFFALYFITAYQRHTKKFKKSVLLENAAVREWKEKYLTGRDIDVRVLKGLRTPLTYGLRTPCILLPEEISFGTREFTYVLNHEYIHVKRHDAFYKIAFLSLACINWFNPFVWCMLFAFNQDMELSCDEELLELMGADCRKSYAFLLLSFEAEKEGFVFPGLKYSGSFLKKRIFSLIKSKGKTKKSNGSFVGEAKSECFGGEFETQRYYERRS